MAETATQVDGVKDGHGAMGLGGPMVEGNQNDLIKG